MKSFKKQKFARLSILGILGFLALIFFMGSFSLVQADIGVQREQNQILEQAHESELAPDEEVMNAEIDEAEIDEAEIDEAEIDEAEIDELEEALAAYDGIARIQRRNRLLDQWIDRLTGIGQLTDYLRGLARRWCGSRE